MSKAVTFGAVGDIDLSRNGAKAIQEHGPDWPFEKTQGVLRQAEVLFGNFESVVLPADYPDDQVDPEGLVDKFDGTAALERAGFDVLSLAANHILDGGQAGMFHTQRCIEAHGIATAGIGRTQQQARTMRVIEKGDLRWGFLCYCEDTNYSLSTAGPCHAYYSLPTVLEDIAANRAKVDVLVVSVHADLEFMETPSWPRREQFRQIAAAGAALVLGHHPHVPQGIERVGRSLVAYSLGNFYFGAHSMAYMRDNGPHTGHSFVLLAELDKQGVQDVRRVPFEIQPPPNERPVPCDDKAAKDALAYLAELDRKAGDDETVAANWRQIALRHLAMYLKRVKKLSAEDLLNDTLGRLLLVAENQPWTREVLAEVKQRWARQAAQQDGLHRPHYVQRRKLAARQKPREA